MGGGPSILQTLIQAEGRGLVRSGVLAAIRRGRVNSPFIARQENIAMTADTKTPLEQVKDVVDQLKQMHHYAKNNVERLTAQWLMFDGELKKLNQADRIENLMTRQSELYDALVADIAALEELVVELSPADEDAADQS